MSYGGKADVLRDVSLEVERGEVVGLIGPVRFRQVHHPAHPGRADEAASAGRVSVEGAPVDYSSRGSLRVARDRFAIVFQQYNLFQNMTALRNVAIAPTLVKKRDRAQVEAEARALLARVGLAEKVNAYPDELSGGQQQRVAIARALALKPDILLLDEVTAALDPELVGEVLDTIRALQRDGMTMLIVSHEMGFIREVASRVAFLDQGSVVEIGPPAADLRRAEAAHACATSHPASCAIDGAAPPRRTSMTDRRAIFVGGAAAAAAAATLLTPKEAAARPLEDILRGGELRVGVNPTLPPRALFNDRNVIDGFEPEVAAAIAQKLGVRLVLQAVGSPERIPMVASGRIDFVMGAMSPHQRARQGDRLHRAGAFGELRHRLRRRARPDNDRGAEQARGDAGPSARHHRHTVYRSAQSRMRRCCCSTTTPTATAPLRRGVRRRPSTASTPCASRCGPSARCSGRSPPCRPSA